MLVVTVKPTGEVAVAGEAHNPQAVRAPDGTFLLMDSYNGVSTANTALMNCFSIVFCTCFRLFL